MKSLIYISISFLIAVLLLFQSTNAQVSRNPSRIPRPSPVNSISDRNRGGNNEKTKERKNPLQQITNPKPSPELKPKPQAEDPGYYCPQPPPEPIYIEQTIIDYHPEVTIIENPVYIIEDNPVSAIEENELAILRYNKAIERNPKDTLLYFLRGNAKLITEDYYGAIEDLTVYLKLVPWDKEAYFKRGLAFLYYGNQKDALLDFQIASELGYKKVDSIIKKYY